MSFSFKVFVLLLTWLAGPSMAQLENLNETDRVLLSSNVQANVDIIHNEYIVELEGKSHLRSMKAQVKSLLSKVGISSRHLLYTYSDALTGFAIRGVPKSLLSLLQKHEKVKSISPNVKFYATTTQTNPSWNLDRIDQVMYPLSGDFLYNASGVGVQAFVLDTGIKLDHDDFKNDVGTSRATCGFSAYSSCIDNHGHGTHVAGIIGGRQYGVAKNVDLIAVKVLDDSGSGTLSGVLAGIEFVIKRKRNSKATPMLINMSLGAGKNFFINKAVKTATTNNITVVVAAGNNYGQDACYYSPSSELSAITVGATMQNTAGGNSDSVASFSNQGSCVDIFAPGSFVLSAGKYCSTCSATMSGTSMASPHVAGVAAQYLQGNPRATPSQVSSAITIIATINNIIGLLSGTPNIFLRTNL